MSKSYEDVRDEMTVKQFNAFQMKVWAALGGRETGEVGMKRLMSGKARLVLEDVVKSEWQRLLETCYQIKVDSDFTEDRWPLEPIAADEDEWEVVKHRFANPVTGEEGLRQLEDLAANSNGQIRLLQGSRRAMEYVVKNPDIQLYTSLIIPLRAQCSDNCWYLPIFSGVWFNGNPHFLSLFSPSAVVEPTIGWLILRKHQK